jgi:dolichol-phosphate mannosyltransferase
MALLDYINGGSLYTLMSVQSHQLQTSAVGQQSEPMPFAVAQKARGPELSVIVPTFNERDNIEPLLMRLEAVLCGIEWEAIFVDDDSPDGTADKI